MSAATAAALQVSLEGLEVHQLEDRLMIARSIQERLLKSGEVCQNDIRVAMESFGFQPGHYTPMASYTSSPTSTNFNVTMEGIGTQILEFLKALVKKIVLAISAILNKVGEFVDERTQEQTMDAVKEMKANTAKAPNKEKEELQALLDSDAPLPVRQAARNALAVLGRFENISAMHVDLLTDGTYTKLMRDLEYSVSTQISQLIKANTFVSKYKPDEDGTQLKNANEPNFAEEVQVLKAAADVATPESLRKHLNVSDESYFRDNIEKLFEQIKAEFHNEDVSNRPTAAQARDIIVTQNPRFYVPLNKALVAQKQELNKLDDLRDTLSNLSFGAVTNEKTAERLREILKFTLSSLSGLSDYFEMVQKLHRTRRDIADRVLAYHRAMAVIANPPKR